MGIRATNARTPRVQVGIDHTSVTLGTIGIESAQHSRIIVTNSVVEHAAQDGIRADDVATCDAEVNVCNTDASYNTNGITAAPGGGANLALTTSHITPAVD